MIIPGEPVAGIFSDPSRMLLEGGDVFEGVDLVEVACFDDAHMNIANQGAEFGFIEVSVFPYCRKIRLDF